jgi:hypothetical protein
VKLSINKKAPQMQGCEAKVYLRSAIKQTYITELSFKGSILIYILALYSAFNMVARTTKLLTN